MRSLFLLLCLIFALCSCGYHVGDQNDQLPGEIRTLYIAMFDNRTSEPFLENIITNEVIKKIARTGRVRIVEDKSLADGILSGVLSGYGRSAVAYDEKDSIVEYVSRITCWAELRQVSDNAVLWKGSVSWTQEFFADDNREVQEDNEALAQEVVAKRLADELYTRMTENF